MNERDQLYNQIGGAENLRSLVNRFYDLMEASPEALHIRALHPASLDQSRLKLFMFLSGWSGGHSFMRNVMGLLVCAHATSHLKSARVNATNGYGV